MFFRKLAALSLAFAFASGLGASVATAQDKPGFGGTAAITGTITYTDGSPVVNRPVEWRPNGNPNGGSTVQTDKNGTYAIQGLTDGEYFIGYFPPDRLPADKNRNLEVAPDAQSAELAVIGLPVIQRVTIKQAQSVKGIDFTITNIGQERIAGPESGGDNVAPPRLPATGATIVRGGDRSWTLAIAVAFGLMGIGAIAFPVLSRRRSN